MIESEWPVSSVKARQDVGHSRYDGKPRAPARDPVLDPKERCASKEVCRGIQLRQPDHALRQDEADVLLQTFVQLAGPVLLAVLLDRSRIEPNDAISYLYAESRYVIGEGVKGASPAEVELRMMPMASEDAVLHGPALERKPHVGTAIVDGVDLVAVRD